MVSSGQCLNLTGDQESLTDSEREVNVRKSIMYIKQLNDNHQIFNSRTLAVQQNAEELSGSSDMSESEMMERQ